MPCLLITVHLHDGRYHGQPDWPPSPARLFQALVAGAAQGDTLANEEKAAFKWLEGLGAPVIAGPAARRGQFYTNFVPNNDRDKVESEKFRSYRDYLKAFGKIRTEKEIRPVLFDACIPLHYVWTFADSPEAQISAERMCAMAQGLYQLGRGVDMAWARGEVIDESEADTRLRERASVLWRPNEGGNGTALSCPHPRSLESLTRRFAATRGRFKTEEKSKKTSQLFSQAPKPSFRQVPYNSPPTFLSFDIRKAGAFAPQLPERIVALTEKIRNLAAERLKASAWRRDDPKRETLADRIFIGRNSQEADKAQRIRVVPLPSIGYIHAERSIRRVLVVVPPNCPMATGDVAWAFSGLTLKSDNETGEILEELVPADDHTMLAHYGIEDAAPVRLWRTVTPAALSEFAARRRIDPRRMSEEAKGGVERLREHDAAEWAVRQALRHAGIVAPAQTVGVQREPFEAKGQRAEAFAQGNRFAKERLWHIEIAFTEPVPGPLLIGDGRYLGLGLMRPVRHTEGVFAFAIASDLAEQADHDGLARALRRAVMARVQAQLGPRATLPVFFTGHESSGAPARSGGHEHLGFAFDAPRKRLIILAPHILERSEASQNDRKALSDLDQALDHFRELRAGAAGKLALIPCHVDMQEDPLFARSRVWESLTPYRVTRHAKTNDPATALETDLLAECRRGGLPRPDIEVVKTFGRSGLGLFGRARLKFRVAVEGPVLLGRDRHFGGGLFVPTVADSISPAISAG